MPIQDEMEETPAETETKELEEEPKEEKPSTGEDTSIWAEEEQEEKENAKLFYPLKRQNPF